VVDDEGQTDVDSIALTIVFTANATPCHGKKVKVRLLKWTPPSFPQLSLEKAPASVNFSFVFLSTG
jgi:hypothetical protein